MTVATRGHVATVEMRRPPNNHVDADLIAGLADALDGLAASGTCRAVVLCSEGRHFCAGARFGRQGGPDGFRLPEGFALYDLAIRLFEQPLPMVAAIQGGAIGGGLGLALVADFRVATPQARFSANFARLGLHHGFGLTVTLPAVVGHQRALEMLYIGRRFTGEEALGMGLCDRLVPAEALRAGAIELAQDIARSAPLAVRSIRQTMRGDLAGRVRQALEREKAEQARMIDSADWREGLQAADERREPSFSGL